MSLLAELLALVAPPSCPGCRRALVRADERLCAACVRGLPWLLPGCVRCGLPVHRGSACPAASAAFSRAWAPMAYQGVARELVGALKFRAALPVADLMAAHMAATLPAVLRGLDAALVPVPPQRARRRARGYDPAGELTRALARRLSSPVAPCLVRSDRAGRQVGAGWRARQEAGRIVVRVRGGLDRPHDGGRSVPPRSDHIGIGTTRM